MGYVWAVDLENIATGFTNVSPTIPVDVDGPCIQQWSPIPCFFDEGNSEYSDEIKERFNTNPTNKNQYLEAIEISHPDVTPSHFLVNDRQAWDFTLENGTVQTHQPYGFAVTLPTTDGGGVSDMNITVDNTDRFLHDFLEQAKTFESPITVTYRIYFADDPTTPQLTPPLEMSLTDVTINTFQVSGRARFVDLVNTKFLTVDYDRKRFPSLGS